MPLTRAQKPGTALIHWFLGDSDDFLNGKSLALRKLLFPKRKRILGRMKTLLAFLFSLSLVAQSPGTVAQSTVSNVVGTAGVVVCTLTNGSPAFPAGVHVVCTNSGASVLVMDSVVPTGTNGMVGSFSLAGNTITWIVNQPVAGPYAWQMAANGVAKSGTF